MILGFVLTIQLMNMNEDYSFVSLKTMSDLQNEVNKEKAELENLLGLLRDKKNRLEEYQKASENEVSIVEVLHSEINKLKLYSGFVDLEGSGIIVKLSDAEREMYEWEDPVNLIIHEEDVVAILNELRFAGAEAISINGQRIISNTKIKCAGPTITIDEHTYGQPFIIKAIGDPATLEAAVKSPESHGYMLSEFYGIIVESQTSPRVRIPKHTGSVSTQYIKLKEGE